MVSLEESISNAMAFHLRPLDMARDLDQVADLIETCFASHMDSDGKEYLRQLRRLARDGYYLHRAVQAASAYTPFSGFVWEEDRKIVGNLSLIPQTRAGQRIYLIANVAVHNDYRRRGIARALTQAAIQKAHRLHAQACWLQVREENSAATHLYQSLGFLERARRTTWLSQPSASPQVPADPQAIVTGRLPGDWPHQRTWLEDIYPNTVSWNLGLDIERLKPGFWNALNRFLNVDDLRHWSARSQNRPIGFITWQPSRSFADTLWLATSPENEEPAIRNLLLAARRMLNTLRPLSVNYPTGWGNLAFQQTGFYAHQTLIWMELPYSMPQ